MPLMNPVMPTNKTLKEEISEKFMEMILCMVNHNVQDACKKFQDNKNKEHEISQKQIKELREDFSKHQCEGKDTIKREVHGLKRTTQIRKQELNKDMEIFRRKNQTEIFEIKNPYSQTKNTMEGHSSRPKQVEGESQTSKIK
jgi:hypothetical protein